jgi:short-subunit dehydrogenase involved in D-alanine esterification of teichoic acids
MTAQIDTILIIGATSGIGEAFVRYFHSKGKKVIAAGRRLERLQRLATELPDLDTYEFDIENISTIESKFAELFTTYPTLDCVVTMAGKMETLNFADASTSTAASIASEITTNFTAPLVIARTVIPHLLSLKRPTTFITVSSALAYIPLREYPVYNGTKSGLHQFTVTLRTQLAGTNVKVLELVPPYVDTELDLHIREETIKSQGGRTSANTPMPIDEYMKTVIATLESGEDLKEISTGFSAMGVQSWRGAFQPILSQFGMAG